MPTAQTIIDEAKLDFPDETDTRALSDLQSIDDELTRKYRLIWSRENITLTADTKEYALPSNTNKVYACTYQHSATDASRLDAKHVDYYDEYEDDWRELGSGRPLGYYVDLVNGNIGFHPTPDTSTSGTYPRVVADVSKRRGTILVSTDFGDDLPSYQAWVEGVRYRMALRTQDERLNYYAAMYRDQQRQLDLALRGSADYQPTVRMKTPYTIHRRRA